MSSNNYKECIPSDNPDYFDGSVRPSGNTANEKDSSGKYHFVVIAYDCVNVTFMVVAVDIDIVAIIVVVVV